MKARRTKPQVTKVLKMILDLLSQICYDLKDKKSKKKTILMQKVSKNLVKIFNK